MFRRALLIGMEGLDWDLLGEGFGARSLPHLERLAARGVCGKLGGLHPILPTPLWNSVATGRRPEAHGIVGDTTLDALGAAVLPFGPAHLRVPSAWDLLAEAGKTVHVIGWPGSHPARERSRGCTVTDWFARPSPGSPESWPLPEGSVVPASDGSTLEELRWHPAEFAANDLEPFVPGVAGINLKDDPRPWNLACHLAASVTFNAVATHLLQEGPWDCAAVYLPAVGNILTDFPASAPWRGEDIAEQDQTSYNRVARATLALHDEMIGTLVGLAGGETLVIVCSLYGYAAQARRRVPPGGRHRFHMELRQYPGFVLLAGPGVRQDEWIFGPHLLDVAPTLLLALGIPLPGDLEGRPLLDAFTVRPAVEIRPAREATSFVPPATLVPSTIGSPSAPAAPVRETAAQNLLNLALFHLHSGRPAVALPMLKEVQRLQPERLHPVLAEIRCHLLLGNTPEARVALETVAAKPRGGLRHREGLEPSHLPEYDLMRGLLDLADGRPESALRHLEKAGKARADLPGYHAHLGAVYLRLRRWEDAARAYELALGSFSGDPDVHFGLARVRYRQRRFSQATEAALEGLALAPEFAPGHLLLGCALLHLGEEAQAIQALQRALSLAPTLRSAHRILARIFNGRPETRALAQLHALAGSPARKHPRPGKHP